MRRLRRLALVPAIGVLLSLAGATGADTGAVAATGQTAARGGVLNVLSASDTDYLDPNLTYYSLGYSYAREFSRQLYTWPARYGHTTDTVPDLAAGKPQVSSDGRTYKITIRAGAMWDTSPARQVTAADMVRGLKTTCNPYQPFGGLPDFISLFVGFKHFCAGYAQSGASAAAMKRYIATHNFAGAQVSAANDRTVVFRLNHRASYFSDMLALPAFSPGPVEMLRYAPGSFAESQHTISDGPYRVSLYQPGQRLVYVRNAAWNPATDPVRKAYVNKIVVTMSNDPHTSYMQMRSGNQSADIFLGDIPYPDAAAARSHHDPRLSVASEIASNPYILYNCASPNNSSALQKVQVRQAISHALKRSAILAAVGHTEFSPPLTHVLPDQLVGSRQFDLYPHDQSKAMSMLQAAGATNMTLKFLYRPSSPSSVAIFHEVQTELQSVGITVTGVPSTDADFYVRYLQNPQSARSGQWDLSLAGWGPDWYGNAALSFFGPLFDGRQTPPYSSNFGLFNNANVNQLIDRAQTAGASSAGNLWHQTDLAVMQQAPIFPLSNPRMTLYHAGQVHNAVSMPAYQSADFTNVWLSPNKNGG